MSLNFPRPPAWTESAICATTDPTIFYPGDGQRGTEAKRICRTCPVISQCLAWALEMDDQHGVFGGTNKSDRRRMRRRAA